MKKISLALVALAALSAPTWSQAVFFGRPGCGPSGLNVSYVGPSFAVSYTAPSYGWGAPCVQPYYPRPCISPVAPVYCPPAYWGSPWYAPYVSSGTVQARGPAFRVSPVAVPNPVIVPVVPAPVVIRPPR